jgi:murein L,D-transpeptidase YafK
MKTLLTLTLLGIGALAHASQKADKVLVKKSEHTLYLLDKARHPFKTFHVVFGPNPRGHKVRNGDERTPNAPAAPASIRATPS